MNRMELESRITQLCKQNGYNRFYLKSVLRKDFKVSSFSSMTNEQMNEFLVKYAEKPEEEIEE